MKTNNTEKVPVKGEAEQQIQRVDYSRKPPKYKSTKKVEYYCDYCGNKAWEKLSSYKKKKRHFCNEQCYWKFRMFDMPIEDHNRYGTGHTPEEKSKRIKARASLNYAIKSGKLERKPCEIENCVDWPEAHHDNYNKPLDVKWLCFKHHREYHYNVVGFTIYKNSIQK